MCRINPAFHRHPDEPAMIGRLVIAFGELEYITVTIAGRAMSHREAVYRALYRPRSTSSRIEAADALMRPTFIANDLDGEYEHMIGAVRDGLRIRNQYSHCNWADNGGLFFTNLEDSSAPATGFEHRWHHVDVPVLEAQEAYFVYAQSWLYHMEYQASVIAGRPIYPAPPAPPAQNRPPLHNPPLQHIPPWLGAAEKDRHVERAQAAEERAHSRQRKQSGPKETPSVEDSE